MNIQQEEQMVRQQIAAIANQILIGAMHPIEGCRLLLRLENSAGMTPTTAFDVIRGIESETDDYPIGPMRQNYSATLLAQYDADIDRYVSEIREPLEEACKELANLQ